MDAHDTVTVEEGDRYPLRPPFNKGRYGYRESINVFILFDFIVDQYHRVNCCDTGRQQSHP